MPCPFLLRQQSFPHVTGGRNLPYGWSTATRGISLRHAFEAATNHFGKTHFALGASTHRRTCGLELEPGRLDNRAMETLPPELEKFWRTDDGLTACGRAEAYGIDLSLLDENLRLSPAERIERGEQSLFQSLSLREAWLLRQ